MADVEVAGVGVAGVGVAGVGLGGAVNVAVDARGELGVMAAIGVAAGVVARADMKLVFIAQVWGSGLVEFQWRFRR